MPLPMVHLGIAHDLLESLKIIIKPEQFYLGSISPDAIHTRKEATKADKAKSHLLNVYKIKLHELPEEDVLPVKNGVLGFISKYRESKDPSFYIGYGIHILTDIYWAKTVYSCFLKAYIDHKNPIQEERWAYYNDTDQVDMELYHMFEWRKKVWDLLGRARGEDVNDLVTAEETAAWNNRTINWYGSEERQYQNPIKYISISQVLNFIEVASNNIRKDISVLL